MKSADASNAAIAGKTFSSTSKPTPTFDKFDGTGRPPRRVQTRFLDWYAENHADHDVFAAQMTVGSGKSAVAKALALTLGAHRTTPANALINQVMATYPDDNFLIGKSRYECHSGLSCQEWVDTLEQKPCDGCPYQQSRWRAQREPTFFNPMSLYFFRLYLSLNSLPNHFPAIVVDEAHQLPGMIAMMASKKFRRSQYKFDDRCQSEIYLIGWLRDQIRRLDKLAYLYREAGDYTQLKPIAEELSSLGMLLDGLVDDPQNYAITQEDGIYRGRKELFLNVRPIRAPRNITQKLLACDKLILLSGTLFPHDIEDLSSGRRTAFVDLPSPIPRERRQILYRPTSFPMNYQTDPSLIVAEIERDLREFRGRNAIIHTTYSQIKKLLPHFTRPVLHNTAENKESVLRRFLKEGGVFLAAGCAEGLDLKDDKCRLNIIYRLNRPDLKDPVVQKRKAVEGGEQWYGLETLKSVMQQAGRSTRHEKDYSITIVKDPLFSNLVNRYKSKLSVSFTESISWTGKPWKFRK